MKNGIKQSLRRRHFVYFCTVFLFVLFFATAAVAYSVMMIQTVNEGRSIADMVEHIGKWASQYGGLHAKRSEGDNGYVGSYLKRSVYRPDLIAQDVSLGSPLVHQGIVPSDRFDAYHWKNPALIQREISDIANASEARTQFRITAKSVLNINNKPNSFELEAIQLIEKAYDELKMKKTSVPQNKSKIEYWEIQDGKLHFARALMAESSCLKCHGSFDSAPQFLRDNVQFSGGGGFGYAVGAPAGVISVTVPLSRVTNFLISGNPYFNGLIIISFLVLFSILLVRMGIKINKQIRS